MEQRNNMSIDTGSRKHRRGDLAMKVYDFFTITLLAFLLVVAVGSARALGLGRLRDWLKGDS